MKTEIPGYKILREIGKGGMGVVYRAQRESDSADLAIKILPPTLITPTTAKRFRREGQALMAVDHPNVVKVYEVDCHDGVHYIAMEYVPGKPLSSLVRAHKNGVPLDVGIRYAVEVGRALSVIHDRGMIHRDLKPGNVMIHEDTGLAKLLDFGLVQVEGLTMLTATGSILGTPLYMSPEQCSGQALDLRTDVYSYGALLFHLFTGSPPFQSASAYELLQMQQNDVPPSPAQSRKDIPPEVSQIILRCLEKAPQDRYKGLHDPIAELVALAERSGYSLDPTASREQDSPDVPNAVRVDHTSKSRRFPKRALVGLAAAGAIGIVGFHPALSGFRASTTDIVSEYTDAMFNSSAEAAAPELDPIPTLPRPKIVDPVELARLATQHWNRGRELEGESELAEAYKEYVEATRLYPRYAYLQKLIDLAPQLERHREVRAIVRDCTQQNPGLDRDGSLRQYLGG